MRTTTPTATQLGTTGLEITHVGFGDVLAFSERLRLAERDGIDPHLAAKVMTDSRIGSRMLEGRVPSCSSARAKRRSTSG